MELKSKKDQLEELNDASDEIALADDEPGSIK